MTTKTFHLVGFYLSGQHAGLASKSKKLLNLHKNIAGRVEATWLQTVEEKRHEWF